MLLKKTLNRFVLKKNPKKNDKPANALPLGRKGRLGFSVYAAAVLCFCCFSIPAFAASDPLGVVNNLSDFIFSLIRAIGLILLGWGVVQVGLSFQSHDPSSVRRVSSPCGRPRDYLCQGNPRPYHRLIFCIPVKGSARWRALPFIFLQGGDQPETGLLIT